MANGKDIYHCFVIIDNVRDFRSELQANELLNDRVAIKQVKDGILQRMEAIEEIDALDEYWEPPVHDENSDDDVLMDDGSRAIRIAGDGEDSGEEEEDQEQEASVCLIFRVALYLVVNRGRCSDSKHCFTGPATNIGASLFTKSKIIRQGRRYSAI